MEKLDVLVVIAYIFVAFLVVAFIVGAIVFANAYSAMKKETKQAVEKADALEIMYSKANVDNIALKAELDLAQKRLEREKSKNACYRRSNVPRNS